MLKDPGTIVQEIQTGFMMKDRLLRPALVAVSKNQIIQKKKMKLIKMKRKKIKIKQKQACRQKNRTYMRLY